MTNEELLTLAQATARLLGYDEGIWADPTQIKLDPPWRPGDYVVPSGEKFGGRVWRLIRVDGDVVFLGRTPGAFNMGIPPRPGRTRDLFPLHPTSTEVISFARE